jgi:hypothetical protein
LVDAFFVSLAARGLDAFFVGRFVLGVLAVRLAAGFFDVVCLVVVFLVVMVCLLRSCQRSRQPTWPPPMTHTAMTRHALQAMFRKDSRRVLGWPKTSAPLDVVAACDANQRRRELCAL